MILVFIAAILQVLLVFELLLRRLVQLVVPGKRTALQHFADTSALTTFLASLLQVATLPLQALGSLLMALSRYTNLIIVLAILFALCLLLSTTFVHMYSTVARFYNNGVAPIVATLRWLFILVDFVFRATVPIYNAITFLITQVLRKIIVPFSYSNFDSIPDTLQALILTVTRKFWEKCIADSNTIILGRPDISTGARSSTGRFPVCTRVDCTFLYVQMYAGSSEWHRPPGVDAGCRSMWGSSPGRGSMWTDVGRCGALST